MQKVSVSRPKACVLFHIKGKMALHYCSVAVCWREAHLLLFTGIYTWRTEKGAPKKRGSCNICQKYVPINSS